MKRSKKSLFSILCFRLTFCCVSSVMFLSSALGTHPTIIDVDTSPLPRGPGLSSAYYGDVGIESNSSVIFADNFETGDYLTRWDAGNRRNLLSLVDESAIDPVLGNRSLRADVGDGADGGAGLIEWFPPSDDSIFVRFDTKFDAQSDRFTHMSVILANRPDDRWSAFGTAGIVPDGTDFFIANIEPVGMATEDSVGRWGTYIYWPDMLGRYGNILRHSNDPSPYAEKDKWTSVELMLKHNTPGVNGGPGLADGELAYWIDGELIGHWGRIRWRDDPVLLINALNLESFLQAEMATPNNVAFFDNVVIASEYIGPSGLRAIPEPATGALLITSLMFIGSARFFRRSGR